VPPGTDPKMHSPQCHFQGVDTKSAEN
jgi:hypothetical protein